jgi:protein gp37
MADKTKIEWTDATWNIINGCTVVSPGCTNCYAMRLAATRFAGHPSREGLAKLHKGKPQWTGKVLLNKKVSLDPMKWSRPRRIFVCAHGDLFHEAVPDHWIDFVLNMAFLAPQHTYQILTKRPERMREYMRMVLEETAEQTAYRFGVSRLHAGLADVPKDELQDINWPPPNVWLGTSVEDQQRADERVPVLLDTPAAKRWLSMEPLLGPVDIMPWVKHFTFPAHIDSGGKGHWEKPIVDWVVVGGESGPGSRPMHPDWLVSLHNQCEAAGVPFLFKQWGDHTADQIGPEDARSIHHPPGHVIFTRVGKRAAGRKLFGVEHDGYPA